MTSSPLVSILIPVYNRAHLITETIQSIVNQTYFNWECVIVDDGSSDNTLNVLNKFGVEDSRIKIFSRPENYPKGANSCRNFAFSISKGEYINWFDSDDIMHPEFISTKLNAFKKDYKCVISKTQFFTDDISVITGKENRTYESNNLLEDFITLKRSWYVCDPLWRKSFLINKQLFSQQLLKGQDRDFHIRMLLDSKINIIFLNSFLTFYRQHDKTISNTFSKEVALSIHNYLQKRTLQLVAYGISNDTLQFMYIQLFKNYRYLRSETRIILLFVLSRPILSFQYIKWVAKFVLASISYRITSRGDVLLK